MDLRFLFQRSGNTVTSVAAAAGVNPSTASRWKDGRKAEWPQITRLYACGLITDADLRAAGLAIPLPPKDEPVTAIVPAAAPAPLVHVVDAEVVSGEDRRPVPLDGLKAVGCVVGVGFLLGWLG